MRLRLRRVECICLSLAFFLILPAVAQDGITVGSEDGATVLRLDEGDPFHRTSAAVRDDRVVIVPGTGTRLALWTEIDGAGVSTPFYAVGFAGEPMGPGRATSYLLKLRHGDFDPSVRAPEIDSVLGAGAGLHIVQFETQPLAEFRSAIRAAGGSIVGYLAHHAHVVRMAPDTAAAVRAMPFVRWIGPYQPSYRVESFLLDHKADPGPLSPRLRYSILVFGPGGDEKKALANRIAGIGGVIDSDNAGKHRIVATLTPDQLWQVVGWDDVQFVDRWTPMETDMDIVRDIGGADYLESVAGYTGSGVRAEIFDSGFNINHPDFQRNPLIEHGGTVGNASHGTATAGINFGTGAGDPKARGLMPDGQGIVADYNNVGLTGANRYTHTGELLLAPYFAVFQTASVGSSRTFDYTTISADHDTLLFDHDVLHCQSQSNAGNQDSRPQAWAKNVLSGGAFNHYNTADRSDDCWCSTGSIGPAADGRIKPDLSFFYDDTYTTYTTGSGYGEFGGTSGATPSICGYTGLFFQMWSDGIFGNEVDPGGTVFDNRPHMTTAKAFMINTASQNQFSGASHDMTRVHQGWGVPDIRNLYDLRNDISFIDESVVLQNLDTVEYNAYVDPGTPAMKITLTYADPAGNPASSVHRINDLTLKVTSPSSDVYWGNHGLLENMWSIPGGAANTVDTVENVFIENPEEGAWIIEIMASEINQDSHVETPEVDADFALVVSGAFMTTCTSDGALSLDGALYACEDDAGIRVVDCDLNTSDATVETVTVTIASDTEPGGESVVLTETGPETATFIGSIPVSTSGGTGVLQVAHGDVVTTTYVDADDGAGGIDITKTDTATVDCVAPIITGVTTTDVQPRTAVVAFDTDEPTQGTVRYGASCGALTETAIEIGFVTNHAITLNGLQDNATYYYAVDAEDRVGNMSTADNGGACYSFTTPEIPDFFTELFSSDNDTDFTRFLFTPNGSFDYYGGCTSAITAFPTDPAGGTTLSLTDDSFETITLTGGATVQLYGVAYDTFYVSSNGFITFNSGSSDTTESLSDHFSQPRISALYDDLNPASAGTVSWQQLSDRVVVTYDAVTEYSQTNDNSFQIEMYFSGAIAINFLTVDAIDGLAGLSEGNGQSPDFFETDLSAMVACGGETCFDGILNQDEVRIDCGGVCPPCDCLDDAECEDGQFCTGDDVCDAYGRCAAGADPCPGEACHEAGDVCVECMADGECDDGLYCNGVETCGANNTCQAGFDPCPFGACDEGTDACAACDNDGLCDLGEDCGNCPGDCISGSYPACGNGICEEADGEDCLNCPTDCNGEQNGKPTLRYCCGAGGGQNPVACGDARCDALGNTCAADPVLAYCCGDGTCNDVESAGNCAADCTPAVPGEAGAGGGGVAMMEVTGYDPATGVLSISYGVPCSASDHTIEYGELTRANLEAYNWSGQVCGIGAGGAYDWTTGGTPGSMFFVVVANNGSEEGSYGPDGSGYERLEDNANTSCPMPQNLQFTCD